MPIAAATKPWVYAHQPEAVLATLTRELRIPRPAAAALVNRGVESAAAAEAFLRPAMNQLHDPFRLTGMRPAVDRIMRAVRAGEHIRVFGDYDVDGTSATALLTLLFRMLSAKHSYVIPRREQDGYGLSIAAIEQAAREGVAVLITVDNGVSAFAELTRARELGLDVIVTDHHTVLGEPPAVAVIHPRLPGQDYPFPHLCGCGMAFKLACGVLLELERNGARPARAPEFMTTALAFAAMATVSDVVPLLGENRVIAHLGLQALAQTRHPGLRALLDVADASGRLTGQDVGFKLGPRINAASRMGSDDAAIRLLVSDDAVEAAALALELDACNRRRQAVERKASTSAKLAVSEGVSGEAGPIVLASADYPPGVAGIIAARLVDAFARPAIVLGIDESGLARGSGRSPRDFHLHGALSACGHLMERFGGHAAAVGITMRADKVAELRQALLAEAPKHHTYAGEPSLNVDALVEAGDLTPALVSALDALGPFGEGNPEPLFAIEGAKVIGRARLMGKTARHLSFSVTPVGGRGLRAVGFGMADMLDLVESAGTVNLAFRPMMSEWGGVENLELNVKDVAAA